MSQLSKIEEKKNKIEKYFEGISLLQKKNSAFLCIDGYTTNNVSIVIINAKTKYNNIIILIITY